MTPTGWLAAAAAIALLGPRSATGGRVAVLADAGRLTGTPAGPRKPRRATAPGRIVTLGLAAVVVAVLFRRGAVLAAATAAAGWAGRVLARDATARKLRAARQHDLRLGLRVLIGELEAGARPSSALMAARDAAPSHSAAFGAAAAAPAGSGEAAAALLAHPDTRPIGIAWQLGADAGMALAGVLDRVAADLHAEQDHRRTVDTVLAGPRASALMLAGLPLVGIGLGVAMGAQPLDVLTSSPGGQLLCLAGVLLDVAGLLWMRRLLARAERS
jgi:tight adherence protein B